MHCLVCKEQQWPRGSFHVRKKKPGNSESQGGRGLKLLPGAIRNKAKGDRTVSIHASGAVPGDSPKRANRHVSLALPCPANRVTSNAAGRYELTSRGSRCFREVCRPVSVVITNPAKGAGTTERNALINNQLRCDFSRRSSTKPAGGFCRNAPHSSSEGPIFAGKIATPRRH